MMIDTKFIVNRDLEQQTDKLLLKPHYQHLSRIALNE
jgi:hypothetical protein